MTVSCDVDFLQLDDLLSEREKTLRSRVRELVEREVTPTSPGGTSAPSFPVT